MSSLTQTLSVGLPRSPRANHHTLLPLDISVSSQDSTSSTSFDSTPSSSQDSTPSSSSETLASQSRQPRSATRHRNRDSLIFINATIPLSPASSTSNESSSEALLDGLGPRRRNGFVRFFCCFGREERARRRVVRETQFEKVGEKSHWSEY